MVEETTTTATADTTTQADTTAGGAGGDHQQITTAETTLLDGKISEQDKGKDGTTQGDKQTGKDAEKPAGAPEKYEFTLADGSALDQAVLGKFEPLFREGNMPQELASKLVNTYAEMRQAETKAQAEAWGKTIQDWAVQSKADKEVGGEGGAAFETNLRAANALLDKFGDPELKAVLGLPSKENPNGLGLGNHPAVVRFVVRMAKAAGEDRQTPERSPQGDQKKPREEVFYGKSSN